MGILEKVIALEAADDPARDRAIRSFYAHQLAKKGYTQIEPSAEAAKVKVGS